MILLHEQSRHYGVPNQTFSSQVISPLCNGMHGPDFVGIGAGGAISLNQHPRLAPLQGALPSQPWGSMTALGGPSGRLQPIYS